MTTRSFNGNQLSVVFGISPIVGFIQDTSLTIETRDGEYNYNHDLHGNVTRSRINDNSATIKITLTQATRSNVLLSEYVELDRQSNSGIFPICIKDSNNNTLFTSQSASIIVSDQHWAQKDREWLILATDNTFN
jgi:hypothetical protein